MIRHRKIRLRLYEYLKGELPPEESAEIALHLERCPDCAAEASGMRTVLGGVPGHAAADERPAPYWDQFAASVERKLRAREADGRAANRARDFLRPVFHPWRRPAVAALAGAMAVVLAAVLFWRPPRPVPPPPEVAVESPAADPALATRARMEQYLRKSKVLLIGLSNARQDESSSVDMSAEREASRQLIHEARYLESQPIDPHAAKLIDNLKKILIELANMKDEGNLPDVEIIRGGIHQENLLFKIRMAESYYDTAAYAGGSY